MDGPIIDKLALRLAASRSRRQVLGAAGKGTIAGFGAAIAARPPGAGLFGSRLAIAATPEPAAMVESGDFFFEPALLEVDAGTTVTWTNTGNAPHTATADDGTFDSGQLENGDTFSHTFDTAGTVAYHCEFHKQMVATVVVNGAAQAPYIRPNVHNLQPDALDVFAEGVRAMKMLPETDPSSWMYQANIHGTSEPQPWLDLWYTCEHGTDFFWPWHRMELYWFEQIMREQSGDPDFALPYWDYSDPARQYLPDPFRDPDSPLYVERRSTNANFRDANSPHLPPSPIFNYCGGLSQASFGDSANPGASSRLEGDVHDPIHGWVGGGTFLNPGIMSAVSTSAQDPVFWLHHANMDRLWSSWRAITLDGASHTDPTDPTWTDTEYEFFDETGAKLNPPWPVHSVLDSTAMNLGYEYEELADNAWFEANCASFRPIPSAPPESAPGTPVAALEIGSNAPEGGIEVGPDRVEVPVILEQLEAGGTPTAMAGDNVVLTLDGIQGTGVPAVSIEVYINLPEGQEPDFRTPYYVGNIGLFTLQPWDAGGPHAGHASTQLFDISRNIAALEEIGQWTGEVNVTLIPVDLALSDLPEAGGGTPEAGAGTPEARGPWVTIVSMTVTTR